MSARLMEVRTLEALRASIAKWQAIVDGLEVDKGDQNCALCKAFYSKVSGCIRCPVMKHTGMSVCDGTPYARFREWSMMNERAGVDTPLTPLSDEHTFGVARAQAMLDFLTSLLPGAESDAGAAP